MDDLPLVLNASRRPRTLCWFYTVDVDCLAHSISSRHTSTDCDVTDCDGYRIQVPYINLIILIKNMKLFDRFEGIRGHLMVCQF